MSKSKQEQRITQSLEILSDFGMPRAQLNERSALTLLALLNVTSETGWSEASAPLIGITPVMTWVRDHYGKEYAPNTRETFRRQTMHQFMEAGIVAYNPDDPKRPVNSPAAVYQIDPECLVLLKTYGTAKYKKNLQEYLLTKGGLAEKYLKVREMNKVPLQLKDGQSILLSSGEHSELIRDIWEDFGSRFTPNGQLVYVGDTGKKHGYFDMDLLKKLGVELDDHGKMPDVIIYYPEKNWLILAESVTSHGPVDAKRYAELTELFKDSSAELVFVSAFPNKKTFGKYQETISWGTAVWIADNPSHVIGFSDSHF